MIIKNFTLFFNLKKNILKYQDIIHTRVLCISRYRTFHLCSEPSMGKGYIMMGLYVPSTSIPNHPQDKYFCDYATTGLNLWAIFHGNGFVGLLYRQYSMEIIL